MGIGVQILSRVELVGIVDVDIKAHFQVLAYRGDVLSINVGCHVGGKQQVLAGEVLRSAAFTRIDIGAILTQNTSWTNGQKPHTLGILCDPEHPALSDFPTEYHSNWQWWDAMSHSNAIILDDFSPDLKPVVRIIDDWFNNHRTALIFEAKVGKGKLLVSGVDLHTNLDERLEAQQLLYSLKKYMVNDTFDPEVTLQSNDLKDLFVY